MLSIKISSKIIKTIISTQLMQESGRKLTATTKEKQLLPTAPWHTQKENKNKNKSKKQGLII